MSYQSRQRFTAHPVALVTPVSLTAAAACSAGDDAQGLARPHRGAA